MQASAAPESPEAAARAAASVKPSFDRASMPPAAKALAAKVARALKAATGPRLARNTAGRRPALARTASEASRSAS